MKIPNDWKLKIMLIRLQKILSENGICSRRAAEELILSGKVYVNNKRADLGDKADPKKDVITVNGKRLGISSEKVYLMLNKPRGFITSMSDEKGRRTVLDLIDLDVRVYPVGRLDYNSEGLLLLTNDGDITYKVTHPSHTLQKGYIVKVTGSLESALTDLQAPIEIDGRMTRPADVTVIRESSEGGVLLVYISEGRNRQIRRLCENAGLEIIRLKRVSIGEINLGKLPKGKWRHLTKKETDYLKKL
jgi:23S rRNA pseudouridine2605 synthase